MNVFALNMDIVSNLNKKSLLQNIFFLFGKGEVIGEITEKRFFLKRIHHSSETSIHFIIVHDFIVPNSNVPRNSHIEIHL